MIKTYTVDILRNDKVLRHEFFAVNKEDFHDMVLLADYIAQHLLELDSYDISYNSIRVYHEDDVIFSSGEEFETYIRSHKIEHRLCSDWSLNMYINDMLYRGTIEEGMRI